MKPSTKFKSQMHELNPINVVCHMLGLTSEQQLGSGHFATVYRTSQGTALKLTVDTKYMEYVELCQNTDNPFLPKIINNFGQICTIGSENTPVFAVELELYSEMYGADIFWTDEDESEYPLSDLFSELKDCINGCTERDSRRTLSHSIMVEKSSHPIMRIAEIYNLDLYPFLDAIHLIYNKFRGSNCFFDLHQGNFMINKSGQVIITDPIGDSGVADCGMYVSRSGTTYSGLMSTLNKPKIDEIFNRIGGDKEFSMFANFKSNVLSEKEVGSRPYQEDLTKVEVHVKLKGFVLTKWFGYKEAKNMMSKRELRGIRV